MNWKLILGGILVWRSWKPLEHAFLRLFPRYRALERELAAKNDAERSAVALYQAEKERNERLEAENRHQMQLVTDWMCIMNGWSPIYGVAPLPVRRRATDDDDSGRPQRRQARDVAREATQEFQRAYADMLAAQSSS